MRIDAHQHFWRIARGDYGWLTPDLEVLYRDFEPADLEPLMASAGVDRTIAVQAAPTVAETRFLLELADANDWIAGVVGWIDMASPDAAEGLAELAKHPKLRGIRPMIQDIPDPDWMLGEALSPAFSALIELGLCFDALVRPQHLTPLAQLIERYPALRVVIDHGAKPEIAAGEFGVWADRVKRIAEQSDAVCKLSGLVTEAAPDWDVTSLRPYVDHLIACFGPDRLMWGSDWPVVELARGYRAWREVSDQLLGGLGDDERESIFGRTAARCYDLNTKETPT